MTSDVFSHLSWVARQVSASTGDEADPWALGGNPNSSAADIARSFRWVSIVDEVILVSENSVYSLLSSADLSLSRHH